MFLLLSLLHFLTILYLQLTILPSLEILDLSRNNIRELPTQPGTLAKLQVSHLIGNISMTVVLMTESRYCRCPGIVSQDCRLTYRIFTD